MAAIGNIARNSDQMSEETNGTSVFERLCGRECLERVHKRLYDKLFSHAVLGAFFVGKEQQFQEDQQSDFLAAEFGGPSDYRGRLPDGAHQHLFITEELFELRHTILRETLDELGIAPDLRDQWLAVDYRFKNQIVKQSLDDCKKRFNADHVIIAPDI